MQRAILKGVLGLLLFSILTGCGFNINSHIGPLLTTEYLDKQVNTEAIDLSVDGQCPDSTLPVIPVNVETRADKYRVYDTMVTHYFRPNEFIDHVVEYMKKRMIQSNCNAPDGLGLHAGWFRTRFRGMPIACEGFTIPHLG